MESILISIKKLLGITEEDTSFDADIIMHINTTFSVLTQLGVGPAEGFFIRDEDTYWTDYLPESAYSEMVKTYMYSKVRMLFDPPTGTVASTALNNAISEFEWRLNVAADVPNQNGGD